MQLCPNRVEGFGPHSAIHPSLPTSCFIDTIVEPLPTWIFLVLMLALIPLRIRHQRRAPPSYAFKPDDLNEENNYNGDDKEAQTATTRTTRRTVIVRRQEKRGLGSRALSGIYYLLIVAELAMISLEIARSAQAQIGIGLLPFTYVGVLVALANRLTWRSRLARVANVLYWLMLAVAMALTTAAAQYEQQDPSARRTAADSGVQGNYPTSDQVVDNAVMTGVEVVLAALEFVGFAGLVMV